MSRTSSEKYEIERKARVEAEKEAKKVKEDCEKEKIIKERELKELREREIREREEKFKKEIIEREKQWK